MTTSTVQATIDVVATAQVNGGTRVITLTVEQREDRTFLITLRAYDSNHPGDEHVTLVSGGPDREELVTEARQAATNALSPVVAGEPCACWAGWDPHCGSPGCWGDGLGRTNGGVMATPFTPPCAAPQPDINLSRISDGFLYRASRTTKPDSNLGRAVRAELKRREQRRAREQYFSCGATTTPTNARDLKPGNVITTGPGVVRMVVRDVYRLAQSGRMLVTFSYVSLVTGEVEDTIRELPLMAQTDACHVVSTKLPDFSALANATS